jgi:hypothetical protein
MSSAINALPIPQNSIGAGDSSFFCFSPLKIYHDAIDLLEAKVGRVVALNFSLFTPLSAGAVLFAGFVFFGTTLLPSITLSMNPTVNIVAQEVAKCLFAILSVFAIQLPLTNLFFREIFNFQNKDIDKIIQNSKGNAKNALVIEASDWEQDVEDETQNKSFSLFDYVKKCVPVPPHRDIGLSSLRFNLQKLGKTHAIQHIFAKSKAQLKEALKRIPDQSVDYLWIRGHGFQHAICLGKDFNLSFDSGSLFKLFGKKVHNNAIIPLTSCSTGKGEYNVARALSSYCPKATVYAPEKGISTFQGTEFKENLIPYFTAPYSRENLTRSFRNGAPGQPVAYA